MSKSMNETPGPPAPSPGLVRLRRLAGALAGLPRDGEAWKALEEVFVEHQRDVRENAHQPGVSSDDRAYWNGGDYCLVELWQKLKDLQSGQWKRWPEVAQAFRDSGEDPEDS